MPDKPARSDATAVDCGALPNVPNKNILCNDSADLSPDNVSKYLNMVNKKSGAELDGFPNVLRTNLSVSLCLPLSIIFNIPVSYNDGQVPSM